MKEPTDSHELYDYLVDFVAELKNQGMDSWSKYVEFAIAQASSSSPEFLGETRIALRHILAEENGMLTDQRRSEIESITRQITKVFDIRR
jgi:hypothetical protein